MVKVEITKAAEKNFLKLPQNIKKLLSKKISVLKIDQYQGKPLSGKLKGSFSLRIWPYRAIYLFDSKKQTIFIYKVQHRKEVYKN